MLKSESLVASYLGLCEQFRRAERLVDGPGVLRDFGHVVFEGAQGLLLDERHRFFPHVTRSRTGLPNVVQIAGEVGLRELDVVYVDAHLHDPARGRPVPDRAARAVPSPTRRTRRTSGKGRSGSATWTPA